MSSRSGSLSGDPVVDLRFSGVNAEAAEQPSFHGVDAFNFVKIEGERRAASAMWTVEPEGVAELRSADVSKIRPKDRARFAGGPAAPRVTSRGAGSSHSWTFWRSPL